MSAFAICIALLANLKWRVAGCGVGSYQIPVDHFPARNTEN
jgi:hypothetical protein